MKSKLLKPTLILLSVYYLGVFLIIKLMPLHIQSERALILAGILLAVHALITEIFYVKSRSKSDIAFILSVKVKTFLRMAIVLVLFFTIIAIMSPNHFVFTGAFFILYFLFQIIELYFYSKSHK